MGEWWWVGGGWRGVVEKILHSDLKISLDETDRDKLERLGSGEDPPSSLQVVGGKRQKRRRQRQRQRGAALRSLECGGESSLSARASLSAGLL